MEVKMPQPHRIRIFWNANTGEFDIVYSQFRLTSSGGILLPSGICFYFDSSSLPPRIVLDTLTIALSPRAHKLFVDSNGNRYQPNAMPAIVMNTSNRFTGCVNFASGIHRPQNSENFYYDIYVKYSENSIDKSTFVECSACSPSGLGFRQPRVIITDVEGFLSFRLETVHTRVKFTPMGIEAAQGISWSFIKLGAGGDSMVVGTSDESEPEVDFVPATYAVVMTTDGESTTKVIEIEEVGEVVELGTSVLSALRGGTV